MEISKKGYDKYELESCVDCLVRAEEIKADKKKMKALAPMLEKKLAGFKRAIDSLDDLREYARNKPEDEEMENKD